MNPENTNDQVVQLYLDDIIPNRFQPRENFDERALKELAVSIKEHGVIQPIVVRQIGEKYEIIAGERRYKASTMAGLTKIPAIITNLDDKESSKVALIENLQRKDLTPIEEARTYQKILELDALTQEELAKTMGKSQSAVSNKLRLLALTDEVQDALLHEQISERHARTLLSVEDPKRQVELLNRIVSTRMTVRELEEEINGSGGSKEEIKLPNVEISSINIEPNVSPTTVDINKIKSSAEDIKSDVPKINFENLLKPISPSTIQEDSITPINDSIESIQTNGSDVIKNTPIEQNKIEIMGGNSLLSGMTIGDTKQSPVSSIPDIKSSDLFGSTLEPLKTEEVINSSTMNTEINNNNTLFGNSMILEKKEEQKNFSDGVADLNGTVKTVKDVVENIKTSGKKVEMEEFDFEDFYQIVIRIDK